jgi:hypothetical protein
MSLEMTPESVHNRSRHVGIFSRGNSMNALYFKLLAIAWGSMIILKGPAVALFGRKWLRRLIDIAYPLKQSFFMWLTGLAGIVIVAFTWWMHAKHPVDYSLVVTLAVTLNVFKSSQVLFNYGRFREFELKLTEGRPGLVAGINFAVALVGIGLILLGALVY